MHYVVLATGLTPVKLHQAFCGSGTNAILCVPVSLCTTKMIIIYFKVKCLHNVTLRKVAPGMEVTKK